MSEDVLLRFLSNGLIDVGGDDAKLDRLRNAAADLAGSLKKSPAKAAAFALIAFDPEAPADDPVVIEALGALRNRWQTYANTFAGPPVAVVRAMLLDALAQSASEDDRIGVAFVTSARNTLPFMDAGHERAIWADVVTTLEAQVDARAEAEWATPEAINVPALSFDKPAAIAVQTSPVSINEMVITQRVAAAVAPQYPPGQPTNNGNPHWPQNGQAWANEFTPRMAALLNDVFTLLANGSAIEPIDFGGPLADLAKAVSSHVDSTLAAVSAATAGLQRRTALIWWKEALYSPSARVSYRDLPGPCAAALMAFDLHQQVPTYSPASVAAFLREAVLGLPFDKAGAYFPLSDLVRDAQSASELVAFRSAAADLVSPSEGRGPVIALIAHSGSPSALDEANFRHLTGVPAGARLTLPEWSAWIFRELQAARATAGGGKPQRRSRRA